MIKIILNKIVSYPLSSKTIERIVRRAAKQELKIKGEVEINIIGDKQIKRLNRQYRGENKITDVLSFAWQEEPVLKSKSLGQIYICGPQIRRQARYFHVVEKEELVRLLVHGLLHLVGYDHLRAGEAQIMFKKQEEILAHVKKII